MERRPHVPALTPPPGETSQIATTEPPGRSTRFNLSMVKKASERPSGDQTTDSAPSVPGRGRGSIWPSDRIHTRRVSRVWRMLPRKGDRPDGAEEPPDAT